MAHQHEAPRNFNTAFAIGVALNVLFIVVEVIFGLRANSLALLADAGHNLSDVLGLLLAWGAMWLGAKRPSTHRTYGFRRSSILAALAKGAVFQRIDDASELWRHATGKGYDAYLKSDELRQLKILVQRRHVLSHRQGIVDETYIDRSGDRSYSIGQRLVVRDADVLELIDLMRRLVDGVKSST